MSYLASIASSVHSDSESEREIYLEILVLKVKQMIVNLTDSMRQASVMYFVSSHKNSIHAT